MGGMWRSCCRPPLGGIWSRPGESNAWEPPQPPEKMLVRWADHEAFLPLNVEDSRQLPPPTELEQYDRGRHAADPGGVGPERSLSGMGDATGASDLFDPTSTPASRSILIPLRRYDLKATFLHRIRRRARVLAQLRANLERPVWGRQALEWRLRGLIGVDTLADRLSDLTWSRPRPRRGVADVGGLPDRPA